MAEKPAEETAKNKARVIISEERCCIPKRHNQHSWTYTGIGRVFYISCKGKAH